MHSRHKIRQKFQGRIQATLIQTNKRTIYGMEYHPSEYRKHLDKHNFTGTKVQLNAPSICFSSGIHILFYCAVTVSSNIVLTGQVCELRI
jgi:hypothetical protein